MMSPDGIHYPHRLRLRGPWECEPLAPGAAAAGPGELSPCRLTLPCRWRDGLGDFAGTVRLRRRFGRPGRIDDYERVWLTFAGATAVAEVWLNGAPLGRFREEDGPVEFEVTQALQPRNELVVVLAGGADGGLWGEVALEVRRTAFLRKLSACLRPFGGEQCLEVDGEAAGTSERPLELYALLNGRTVLYRTLQPLPAGQPFHFVSEPLEAALQTAPAVRLDLVDGAVIWYAAAVPLSASVVQAPDEGQQEKLK